MRAVLLAQGSEIVASSRTRVFAYLPYLERAGVEADLLVWNPEEFVARTLRGEVSPAGHVRRLLGNVRIAARLLHRARDSDVVLVQKVVLPAWYLKLLRRRTGRLVFDYDDALDALPPGQERGIRGMLRSARVRAIAACLAHSDAALVENAPNRDFAARHCSETVTITGPIDTDRYRPAPARADGGPVVIGWIGTPTTAAYLRLVAPALTELARRGRRIAVHLIGAAPWSLDGVTVRQFPWSLDGEVAALDTLDIGLMPLTDDGWARGKGGYKILQYMAMGLPTVASPVGVNAEMVRDGVTGYLAADTEAWVRALDALVTDAAARRRMGTAARAEAIARYSLEHYAPIWLRALGVPKPEDSRVAEAALR